MDEIHLRNQAAGAGTQPWDTRVTETLKLGGHVVFEHTLLVFFSFPTKKVIRRGEECF